MINELGNFCFSVSLYKVLVIGYFYYYHLTVNIENKIHFVCVCVHCEPKLWSVVGSMTGLKFSSMM